MLSTVILYCLTVVSFIVAVSALIYAVALRNLFETQTFDRLQKSRLTAIETELTELSDSYERLITSQRKLRGRLAADKRNSSNGSAIPDSVTDPQGYKAAMRRIHLHKTE